MSRATHTVVTEPFRAEHAHLAPHVDRLAETGDLRADTDAAYRFLTDHLIPHAQAEDEVLYPEVDRLVGAEGETRATDTMRRDHLEVARLTEELGELRERLHAGEPVEELELRRVLFGLYAVVRLHFAKEEEVYLPLLDRELTADEAQALFERMESAGHAAAHVR
jgi:iron-sulfur cluster repair protein YtfE (RIC family)